MVDLQPSLLLRSLTHDVRLEIYSHIILPPFNGCRDYTGLLLSCRQLKEEMECEAMRQLRVYLQNISKDRAVGSDSIHADMSKSDNICGSNGLEFVTPSTVLGHSVIGVKVPFLLPPVEHDWHYENYPVAGFCGTMYHPSQPESPYQRAARLHDEQRKAYSKQTAKLLQPIRLLHKLHLASIDLELVLDESTAVRVAGGTKLEQELKTRRQQILLGTTVLGRFLDVYITELGLQGYYSMRSWSEDWAFNVSTINVAWNFSSETLASSPQDWICCSRKQRWGGIPNRASCAPDRRIGTAQVLFNVGSQIQGELRNSKRGERIQKIVRRIGKPIGDGQKCEDEDYAEIARCREKLRRLGIQEGDDPEPDALEISMTVRAAKIEAEREIAAS